MRRFCHAFITHCLLPGACHGRIRHRETSFLGWAGLFAKAPKTAGPQTTHGFRPAGHGHARPKRWPPSGWSCRHCPAPENSCFLQIEFMFAPSIPLPFLPGNSHGPVDLVRVHEPARPLLPLPRTALCGVRGNGQARGHLAHVPGGQEIQRSCGAHRSSA